jgi:hypothetical protein
MNVPTDLADLLEAMATDLPAILDGNLVGMYLWGSLTYTAFDPACSDIDCVAVTASFPNSTRGSTTRKNRTALGSPNGHALRDRS